ncbi:hypothetical protein H0H87_000721 [Tephrocybe sp. NHM501043]|nr:hypothetical protein H0H87_000721 [Tephrocybe sp. NHM501043]
MSNSLVSSRSSGDAIEGTSDVGLAEWSSKIKAMQRQVDADEEAEQTRLEQEIAASRLARKRRSQGLGYAHRTNLDVSRADGEYLDSIPNDTSTISTAPDALQSLSQPTTNILSSSRDPQDVKTSHTSSEAPTSSIPQHMSLAAFMGGKATGPRLKKHAPQQDTHDPTQFQQRSFDRASHPTFGSGGIALPGIAVQRDGPVKPSAIVAAAKTQSNVGQSYTPRTSLANSEVYSRQSPITRKVEVRERTTSFPSSVHSISLGASTPTDSEAYGAQPTIIRKLDVRERTTSVPAGLPSDHTPTKQVKSLSYGSQRPSEPSLGQDRAPRLHNVNTLSTDGTPTHRPKIPLAPTEEASSPRSPYTAPPLAGPIRPQPRPSTSGPQIPTSVTPSKAFARPLPQKELTPSLSRLQGRGFVQSMVKVSSQIESPPSIIETPEKSTPPVGRRTSSVLDRWQANVPTTTPSPSPAPRLARKSVTFDLKGDKTQPPPADPSRKPLKGSTSQPSMRQENVPPGPNISPSKLNPVEKIPPIGLGSATTLVVYKPTPVEAPTLDEFGVRPSHASKALAVEFPAPSKPLSHPTKERARKPQKRAASGAQNTTTNGPISSQNVSQKLSVDSRIDPAASPMSDQYASHSALEPQRSEGSIQSLEASVDKIRHSVPRYMPTKQPTMNPTVSPVTHTGDARRLVRKALPGITAPQVGEKHRPNNVNEHARTSEIIDQGSIRRALPGLAAIEQPPLQPPPDRRDESTLVSSPTKSSRIPSTGNRPTVMDVAQVLIQNDSQAIIKDSHESSSQSTPHIPIQSHTLASPSGHAEKRRSSFEKYSSIILPSLKEVATPAPTPTGTLSRKVEILKPSKEPTQETRLASETADLLSLAISPGNIRPTCKWPSQVAYETARDKLYHEGKPILPNVNFDLLVKNGSRYTFQNSGSITMSVEIMAITGTTASTLSTDQTIFYDTEVLAIIHRSKSQLTGLVSTSVWGWEGKRATLGPREQRKLYEIAQRYGATADVVQQNSEPPQLVHILGGVLAIRQGTRTHWTSENTAMHLVRSLGGVIFIDEKDLSINNLCSGYSYCVTILDSVYVWYGRGSTPLERKAALEYGHCLASAIPPIELTENGSKEDEMFWMILGDNEYANADYWKWRTSSNIDPRAWRVKAGSDVDCVRVMPGREGSIIVDIFIRFQQDCVWEFYVVIGSKGRALKDDIELALGVAMELSGRVSSARPYPPTVHTLILPSQIPRDLRLMFRDLDEFSMVQFMH